MKPVTRILSLVRSPRPLAPFCDNKALESCTRKHMHGHAPPSIHPERFRAEDNLGIQAAKQDPSTGCQTSTRKPAQDAACSWCPLNMRLLLQFSLFCSHACVCVCVPTIRAVLFGIYFWAPDFWKLSQVFTRDRTDRGFPGRVPEPKG